MTTRQTPNAVREAVARIIDPKPFEDRSCVVERADRQRQAFAKADAILAALDSRAGDAFDMPEYAPDDISHLEGLASYLDGVARDKGRAGLPASKSLFEEIAKRLREYDVIRNRGRAGDAGEGKAYRCRGCGWRGSEPIANGHPQNGCDLELMVHDPIATPAPAVDAREVAAGASGRSAALERLERHLDEYYYAGARDDLREVSAFAVDAQQGDDEGPCTDCEDTGITIQTERACSCEAGDQYRAPAVDAVPAGEVRS